MKRYMPETPFERGTVVAVTAVASLAGLLALSSCGSAPRPDRAPSSAPVTRGCTPGMTQLHALILDKNGQRLLAQRKMPANQLDGFTRGTPYTEAQITDFLVLRQYNGAPTDTPSWDQVKQLGQAIDSEVQPAVPQRIQYAEGSVDGNNLSGGEVAIIAGVYQGCELAQGSVTGGVAA